ncbi:reticulon-1a isoform X1 [Electrophorus electricus]|uniref:Reticulon n=1 Tax=Electrophorus electricus TaxID=8005 RepID=A0A4W4EES2_ELEEL|nr:reticulon-1a isoform X1 [Electrophorus electricus]
MSGKLNEDPGLDEQRFAEEPERNGMFGSTGRRFDEMRDELHSRSWEDDMNSLKQFYPFDKERKGAGVAMETASTDDSMSGLFQTSSSGQGDLYTSLLSSHSSSSNPFGGGAPLFPSEGNRSPSAPTGTDSGIGMTPGDPSDLQVHKVEPYNYMDMSDDLREPGQIGSSKVKQQPERSYSNDSDEDDDAGAGLCDIKPTKQGGQGSKSDLDPFDLGHYLEKSPPATRGMEAKGGLGFAREQHTFSYMGDPSDEETVMYHAHHTTGTPQPISPVKITVTADPHRPPPQLERAPPQGSVSERDSVLSFGQQGVPTVTLSEPEDDSAASSASHSPNLSPTGRESPSDVLFQPVAMKSVSSVQDSSAPYQDTKCPAKPAAPWDMSGFGGHDQDGSGEESGDSEIEQVAEEPDSPRHDKPQQEKMGFGQSGNPFEQPSEVKGVLAKASNPFEIHQSNKGGNSNPFELSSHAKFGFGQAGNPPLYSLLREEREAELDSDLLIESASEESPKREQGYSGPEPSTAPAPSLSSNPISTPPAVTESLESKQKQKEKHKEKEKDNVIQVEKAKPQPPQGESSTAKPMPATTATSAAPAEQRPKEDWESKSKSSSEENVSSTHSAELPLFLQNFNKQKAVDLLHWRDVKRSGLLFGSVLLLLFSLTQFSVVSVGAYLALATLSASISFRVYKSVLQAVQKTDEGHPFKAYLEMEIALSPEQISKYVDKTQLYVNYTLRELRRLFLVQDLVDSIKFAVLMWLLTYVGAIFNGLTLLLLAVVSMFTMPVVYEKYQTQIDQYLGLVRTQVNSIMGKIREKVPGAKRKNE